MRKTILGAAAVTAVVALGAVGAGSASAADSIYWMQSAGGAGPAAIGRASLDGSSVNESFIPGLNNMSSGLVSDATHLYWFNGAAGTRQLSRASLDGSGVVTNLVDAGANNSPRQIGLQGSNVYFASSSFSAGGNVGRNVARVGTNGLGLDEAFVPSIFGVAGNVGAVAVNRQYIFSIPPSGSNLARANLADGSGVNSSLVTGLSTPTGLAADDNYVYWTTSSNIGRAKVDGSDPDDSFMAGGAISDVRPGIAVTSRHIYWASGPTGGPFSIGRANLDGTDRNATFITGLTKQPLAITVTASTPAPTPTPTPTPAPAPAPTATTLATPTVNTNAPGKNAVVTVRTQLGPKGKYTFIFQKPTSNEMSRETQASGRVPMQKGTRLGKRILRKTYTAAVITTTADNAKVVTRALLRKAQARKLNLRVIYSPTGGAQTESVIKIK